MADIVLVHGGWHGGWCWKRVRALLEQAGHRVLTPTMTGVGERKHLAHEDISPDLHVTDIANVILFEDLSDIILVGHSYGGMIITGVADHLADRIAALVYLDAFVPERSGEAANTLATPERRKLVAEMTIDGLVAPFGFERWCRTKEDRAWVKSMATPHPLRSFAEGVTLSGRDIAVERKLYILCTQHKPSPFWAAYERVKSRTDWRTAQISCLHDAMIDAPDDLARYILSVCD